jgi:porphobilinogen synthase
MFLQKRSRILRLNPAIRSLVAETHLGVSDFIAPLFIDEGKQVRHEIPSMPGYFRNSLDITVKEVKELYGMGLKSVLLFIKCKDELKDNRGKEAWNADGLMQRSIRAIKDACCSRHIVNDRRGPRSLFFLRS